MRRPRLVRHGDSPGTGLPGMTSFPLPEKTSLRRQHRARWPNVSVGTACPACAATTTTGTTSGTGEPLGAVRAAISNPLDAAAYVNKHYPAGGRGGRAGRPGVRVLGGPGAAGRAGALLAPAATRGRLKPVCFGAGSPARVAGRRPAGRRERGRVLRSWRPFAPAITGSPILTGQLEA
jgi:hypothetical protein